MGAHWPICEFVCNTVAMKIGGLDKDGIDVQFTIDHNHLNISSPSPKHLRERLREARPTEGERHGTDMASTLERIFNAYLKENKFKATTVIIFTDAIWEGSRPIDNIIVKFAHDLAKHTNRLDARHFTIGFIRFGDGTREKLLLKYLDDDLCRNNDLEYVAFQQYYAPFLLLTVT